MLMMMDTSIPIEEQQMKLQSPLVLQCDGNYESINLPQLIFG
jgi:hypothetical protein